MVWTEHNHLTTEELISLALSREQLTPLERELLTRLMKKNGYE
jgi:hypothetical protein